MEVDKYSRVLHTIEVLLDVYRVEITELIPGVGVIKQSPWNRAEDKQIKEQILGMLKLIPDAKNFNDCFE